MAIQVKLIGENDGTDEYLAALRMKEIIQSSTPSSAMGEIILFPSATLYGQAVKDVDIMMIGHILNYKIKAKFQINSDSLEEDVEVKSFCTTIEVKSHQANAVSREGTNFYVQYPDGRHNATKQSNDQRISAMNYFRNSLGGSPFITNLLWFTEVTANELHRLTTSNGNTMISNVLPTTFGFEDVAQLLIYQRAPWRSQSGKYEFECGFGGNDPNAYYMPLMHFSRARAGMGELTRKKIEQITSKELEENDLGSEKTSLTILRGRAGTGKTIELIRYAIFLVDSKNARVQILTYNRALVSDIRRLFALAELPDMFDEKCVSISTMQSYFYGLISGCLYDGELSGDVFIKDYDRYLKEMIDFLGEDIEAKEIIKSLCEENPKLNWEYVLIDEAQDWSEQERNLILMLFDPSHIVVADGGQQFVRNIKPCDWSAIRDRNNLKLKYCLRQKNNIVKFINNFIGETYSSTFNKILPSGNMNGGKIIIVKDNNKAIDTVKREMPILKQAGNIPYDMLVLTPSSLVEHGENKKFLLRNDFEHKGILIWDGTTDDRRLEYSINSEEARALQYESSRGLEGWTVCCLNFDEFLDIKEQQYEPSTGENALLLESAEDKKQKYLMNWALIPLTRAIDTLIITIKSPEAEISKKLLAMADKYPDYVEVIS